MLLLTVAAFHFQQAFAYDVQCGQTFPSYCFIGTAIDLQENDDLTFDAMDHAHLVTHFEIAPVSNLRRIPKIIFETFPHLEAVTLNSANIKSLSTATFEQASALKDLHLKMNEIFKLYRAQFAQASNLETIDLSENGISSIEDEAFSGLSKLRTLKLSGNRLKVLKTRTLFGLENLEFLHLYSNKLATIEWQALQLPKLTEVFFGNNRLRTLPNDLFAYVPDLEITEFSSNRLTHIGDTFDSCCQKVYSLNFENNPIEDIDLLKFARLRSLSNLSLNCTNFKFPDELPAKDNAIVSSSLESLNLANNNLSNANIFDYLITFPEIQRLYLYNNKFTEFHHANEIKNILPKLNTLDLIGNDLIANWLHDNSGIFKQMNVNVMRT